MPDPQHFHITVQFPKKFLGPIIPRVCTTHTVVTFIFVFILDVGDLTDIVDFPKGEGARLASEGEKRGHVRATNGIP